MSGLLSRAPQETGTEVADEPSRPRPRLRVVLTLAVTVALTLLWAGLAMLALNASSFPASLEALRTKAFEPVAWLPSLLVLWVVVLLVVALVGRLWLGLGIVTVLTAVLGMVNMTKMELRNDPVYPADVVFLSQPSFLFDMVSGSRLLTGAAALGLTLVVAWGVGRVAARFFPPVARQVGRRGLIALRTTRVVVVLLCLGLLNLASDFNEADNPWRAAFDATGLRWTYWDQRVNYQRNGFVPGLLFNTHITAMARPKGYSQERMQEIATRYRDLAARTNQGRTGSLDDTNIILVLSESFADPTWLKTVRMQQTPIPFTTRLMKRTVGGRMLAPGFGGGTANVEFELLTGQSLSQFKPQLSIPYEQLVPREKEFPSLVEWLSRRGHHPIALHPFSPRMYSRPEVFDIFGFEEFITKDTMTEKARLGGRFISDQAAFDETLLQMREHDDPLLLHLISMQNHMPYGGQYDDPHEVTGLPPKFTKLAGQYARGLTRTDQAVQRYLGQLSKEEEPTAVIFYGDHLPAQVYPPDLARREGKLATHQTPYFIWSNKKKLSHRELPMTSPTQFLPQLFDAMEVPVPPYLALLSAVRAEVPAIDAGIAITPEGKRVKPGQLDAEAKRVLADYRMVLYDLSIGERYSQKVLFGDPPQAPAG